jgi:ribosomal-protein-alanine N-acetyltransferase
MSERGFSVGPVRVADMLQARAESLAEYFSKNARHLAASMPARSAEFYSQAYWQQKLIQYQLGRDAGTELRFVLLDENRVVGLIGYDQIVRGAFQACYLGYSLDADYQGKGLMHAALCETNNYVIAEVGLNRIMANYPPANIRSAKLLATLGFEREGYARRYLKLNGVWQDHVLTAYLSTRD